MTKALDAQVGGSHYKIGIQPFQLSMANGHDGCTHAIQKYLTRYTRLAEEQAYQALQKAPHICMIRVETMALYGVPHPYDKPLISIGDYCRSNKLNPANSLVITQMELWFRTVDCNHLEKANCIRALIRQLAYYDFPQRYSEEDFKA